MDHKRMITGSLIILIYLTGYAQAVNPAEIIRQLICQIWVDLQGVIWGLAVLMFLYGGAKYAYSADDPGGRKQARSIAIHALVGLIIVVSASAIIAAAGGNPAIC
ncbi:hypothetical protein ACFLRF_00175 [Candidatus Altiarchaeota archaeon]